MFEKKTWYAFFDSNSKIFDKKLYFNKKKII